MQMKLGIVGTGKIVRELLPHLGAAGWEPCAICGTERSREKRSELQKEFGIPQGFTDFSQMLTIEMDAVYLGIPNFLHFSFAKQALESGKNVIVEKPITSNAKEAEILAALAREKGLYLFEAITTPHMNTFRQTRQWLSEIGTVKLVQCNFSQYSSRYDAFRRGEIQPVFDPAKSGGTLMDLNIYNLHYMVALFGMPQDVHYFANVEQGIDTSGTVVLEYPGFHGVCTAAKDCGAPCICIIQGTKGYLRMDAPANCCGNVTLHCNDGSEEFCALESGHRMEPEFRFFREVLETLNWERCDAMLSHSLRVAQVQTEARKTAGILFPADQ